MKYLLEGQETERLFFRMISETDSKDWTKFFEERNASLHWVEEEEAPMVACRKWYQKQYWRYENDQGGMNALVEKSSGRLVGHCGLLIQSVDDISELEIGYALLPEFRNRGYASEAVAHCKDYAFQNRFSDSLISIISLTNRPSQKVASRNGMFTQKETIYHENKVYIFRVFRSPLK